MMATWDQVSLLTGQDGAEYGRRLRSIQSQPNTVLQPSHPLQEYAGKTPFSVAFRSLPPPASRVAAPGAGCEG